MVAKPAVEIHGVVIWLLHCFHRCQPCWKGVLDGGRDGGVADNGGADAEDGEGVVVGDSGEGGKGGEGAKDGKGGKGGKGGEDGDGGDSGGSGKVRDGLVKVVRAVKMVR
jgi:uncharacterized membrane protein YgcG